MPTTPYEGSNINATDASIANYTRIQYPNPFFDLSRHYFPKTVKSLFKYCRIYFYQNEFIHNVINKLASYPITDFIYEGISDETVKENYRELNDHYLKLKSFLIEAGLDYFVYGNCIISANMKFKRFLECPICHDVKPVEKRRPYRFIQYEFVGKCDACNNEGVKFKLQDKYLKNPKYFKFIRWAPENITIDYDDLTGESRYFYTMNERIRKQIMAGKVEVIERVPELFIKAVKESKKIELDPKNLYHFKRPTLAEEDQGWGKPILLPAMKILWYMQTLRRGNEAIVADHLIPMRSVFPSSQSTLDPFSMHPDTWINTTEGLKQLKDITLSTKLITYDLKETSIKAIVPRDLSGIDEMYSVSSWGHAGIDTKVNSVHPFRVYDSNTKTHVWKQAKDLTLQDYTAYPVTPFGAGIQDFVVDTYIKRRGYKKNSLPAVIKADKDFFRFLGFFISEGSAASYGPADSTKVRFSLHQAEVEYQEFIINYISKLIPGIRINKMYWNNGCCIQVTSNELGDFLKALVGQGAKKKNLLGLRKNLSKDQAISLLQGIFDGDGCEFVSQTKQLSIEIGLSNLQLITDIRELLLSLGVYSYTNKGLRKQHDAVPALKIYGEQAAELGQLLGWNTKLVTTTIDTKRFFFKDGFVYSKVREIKNIADHVVYSIEVADTTHSYLSLWHINKNTQMNLGQWRSNVEEQILRWRRDPNHIGTFPIPIGYQSLGGDARMLMVTPELKYLEESIINSLGVPIEFIKGGSTWTSSSVSLRIVENGFLNYREQLYDFLNYFAVPKIKYFLGYPAVTIKLKKFKMSDDVQAKELLIQLSQLGKLSDSFLLEEFGIDAVEERKYRKSDSTFNLELQADQMKAQAEAQGRGQVIMSRYQAQSVVAAQEEASRINERKFAKELILELGITNEDPSDVLQKQVIIISHMPPEQQQQFLGQLQKKAPYAFSFIMTRMQNTGAVAAPEEERAMQMQQQQTEMEMQKMQVEGKYKDKDLERKKEEAKLQEKTTATKMVADEQKHRHKVEESKLPKKDAKK